MSRKHYIALAAAFRSTFPGMYADDTGEYSPAYYQWRTDIAAVADVLQRDNPRFGRNRFIIACRG